ncbi:MAG: alpha/beta hydrolase [Clostridia bacterium]|nr:alpha/beta hydrolase [Clostridia bacterium]MBR3863254.1 alpha/beta hydrolase [Clostridia bacterium]
MIYETIQLGDFSEATLTPICYSNPKELSFPKRRAVIVCPGGGYNHLSPREAEPIAAQFLAAGFATFILRYGVGENAANYRPLKQLALAIRHVRENAQKYSVDPDYVFVCGFSAGGHLAASAGILWNAPVLDDIAAGAQREIVRPTGMILSYPVISAGKIAHRDSFYKLCGKEDPSEAELNAFSLERHVSADTPPAFIWHTFADQTVPVQNSLLLAEAMTEAGVPFELHVFPQGRHGLALCNELTAVGKPQNIEPHTAQWLGLALRWATDFTL